MAAVQLALPVRIHLFEDTQYNFRQKEIQTQTLMHLCNQYLQGFRRNGRSSFEC